MDFNLPYDRNSYVRFFRSQFLPEDFNASCESISLSFSPQYTQQVTKIGQSRSLDLNVYEVKHTSENDPRVSLSKESFRLLAEYGQKRALVLFISKTSKNYRLSLVTIDLKWEEGKRPTTEYSNPRRFSFFLGPDAKVHTPEQYLVGRSRVKDFGDIKNRFSIEVVNQDFYTEIAILFTKLTGGKRKIRSRSLDVKKGALVFPSPDDTKRKEFAVRLIGRLVFCWFLQKKRSQVGIPLLPEELLSSSAIEKTTGLGGYYHSILEPLFFEVLNTPVEERAKQYKVKPWNIIPFLNGGLFTDHEDDFYGRNEKERAQSLNTLVVPNDWLEKLVGIFETYNFTIDENTPVDVELSIEPEMLGRIFENLLAEINPETSETARKATGSYYTPRPIVEYMVDESLKQYLQTKTQIGEDTISSLLSYADEVPLALTEHEQDMVIDALHAIRIIDPACGSGAFPMGILQKILLVLQKIDPDSNKWLERMLASVPDSLVRKELIKKVTQPNYLHKLGVIRDCIFGVDIQPIAVEIAKLRCFLSLIVDQNIDDSEENRGVEHLPNLEFKFVCANSLIGLPKRKMQQTMFEATREIKELEQLRDEYFQSYEDRMKFEKRFQTIRSKMLMHIEKWSVKKDPFTIKLLDWNPFSDEPCHWFDYEWMFGIGDGFDIVIANPPYLKERDNKERFSEVNNSEYGKKYHQGKMDFWYYFLHKAIDILKTNGTISYITSRYWLNSTGAKKLIARVKEELSFVNFLDIGKLKVFDSVAGQHMVAVYAKNKTVEDFIYKNVINNLDDIGKNQDTSNITVRTKRNSRLFSDSNEIIIEDDLIEFNNSLKLGVICDISQGVVEAPDKLSRKRVEESTRNDLKIGQGVFVLDTKELRQLCLNKEEEGTIKKYLDPNDVFRYGIRCYNEKYLIYSDKNVKHQIADNQTFAHLKKHLDNVHEFITSSNAPYGLHRPRENRFFDEPKIIFKNMFVDNEFTYDEDQYCVGFSFSLIIQNSEDYSLKYVLAVLNSKFALDWFYRYGKKRGAGFDIGVNKLRTFPIKELAQKPQEPFINLVDKILNITKTNDYLGSPAKQAKVKELEKQIDQMVYKLYGLTKEEIAIVEEHSKSS